MCHLNQKRAKQQGKRVLKRLFAPQMVRHTLHQGVKRSKEPQ
jgi:hypothetical protein